MWTFTANTGDSINLRLGTTSFNGKLQLYGPNGALLVTVGANGYTDDLIAYTATNSGTFTVLVSAGYGDGTGTYVLHLAQIPEAFIVPAGDEGGAMTGAQIIPERSRWAIWTCGPSRPAKATRSICGLKTTNFDGNLQLYGPNGALLKTVGGHARMNHRPTQRPTAALLPCWSAVGYGRHRHIRPHRQRDF